MKKQNIMEFCKENRNVIVEQLSKKNLTIQDSDEFTIGYKEILDKDYNCNVLEDVNVTSIYANKKLVNHVLPHQIVMVDLSFKKKKYCLEVNGVILYYKYCIL